MGIVWRALTTQGVHKTGGYLGSRVIKHFFNMKSRVHNNQTNSCVLDNQKAFVTTLRRPRVKLDEQPLMM
jgi:hypothetical protein